MLGVPDISLMKTSEEEHKQKQREIEEMLKQLIESKEKILTKYNYDLEVSNLFYEEMLKNNKICENSQKKEPWKSKSSNVNSGKDMTTSLFYYF